MVVKTTSKKYDNFYLCVEGDDEEIAAMQRVIAKRGFTVNGERYFRDQIESLSVKELSPEDNNEVS